MIIAKKNRTAIYEALFKDGVVVAIKDFNLPKHHELEKIPNLEVIKAMQSLKSRGYVRENFAWRHYYWYLTNEGIQYLREYLHLPPEIVPATFKRQPKTDSRARPRASEPRSPSGREADRDQYRRGGMESKPAGAGSDFQPEFRGSAGIGRGRGGFGAPPS